LEEAQGEKLLEKYVAKVKEKPKEAAHVGGAFPKKDEPLDKLKMNKLGLDSARDY